MESPLQRGAYDVSDVESDAVPPQNYPWSKSDEKASDLTYDEEEKLVSAIGKLTSWLGGAACQSVPVPGDLRSLLEKLPGSKKQFQTMEKVTGLLTRLHALEAISLDFKDEFLAQTPETQQDKMDDFFGYLFRRGMRAVLNFTKVLWEENEKRDVINVVDHIARRGYIVAESVISKAEKAGYVPESSITTSTIEVKRGKYQGGSRIYEMSAVPRGLCLIINNEKFHEYSGYKDRKGTSVDGENLASLFTQMGFHIYGGQQFFDLSAAAMTELIQNFARDKRHVSADACVVCVLSHGTYAGRIAGVDGNYIIEREVDEMLKSSSCPALAGKPKLLFYIACRGNSPDGGLTMMPASSRAAGDARTSSAPQLSSPSSALNSDTVADAVGGGQAPPLNLSSSSSLNEQALNWENIQKIPDYGDFLRVYSTGPGLQSYRHVEQGTWFVQEFVKVISEEACLSDIFSMLTEVNNRIGGLTTSQGEKQSLEFRSSLRFTIFFNPGF